MSVPAIYGKMFGAGLFLGAGMELLLIKSNYYGMLLASEAKARMKELQQEQEDLERIKRLNASKTSVTSNQQ
ncbi:unnamed protein product [Cunninghamella echinulata]